MRHLSAVLLCAVLLVVPARSDADRAPLRLHVKNPVAAMRDSAVGLARVQLGKKYVFGASSPKRGFDCSGLMQYVLGSLKVMLPRTVREQAKAGVPVFGKLRPGDLVLFGKPVRHVGIYTGDGFYINASSIAGRVVERSLQLETVTGVRRVIGSN